VLSTMTLHCATLHHGPLQTERAKLAAALVTAARRAVLLSGTPALNRPKELFTQVQNSVECRNV
jgi:hypothetical protein